MCSDRQARHFSNLGFRLDHSRPHFLFPHQGVTGRSLLLTAISGKAASQRHDITSYVAQPPVELVHSLKLVIPGGSDRY